MKAVVQRVRNASVTVNSKIEGQIDNGILVYVGITHDDNVKDVEWMVNKLPNLRIFTDENNKMNNSVTDLNFGILVISQFTLMACCKRGRRPSYERAAPPEYAKEIYNNLVDRLKSSDLRVETGVFQAHMDVEYINDGPITVLLDSKE